MPLIPGEIQGIQLGSLPLTYGLAFPANPVDGQEHILVDSLTNSTYSWRFRFNAGSALANKWEFIGGAAARADADAVEGNTSAALIDLTTTQWITLPRSGDYDVRFSCGGQCAAASILTVSITIGGVQIASVNVSDPGTNTIKSLAREKRVTGRTAGEIMKMQYAASAGAFTFRERGFSVTPYKVS